MAFKTTGDTEIGLAAWVDQKSFSCKCLITKGCDSGLGRCLSLRQMLSMLASLMIVTLLLVHFITLGCDVGEVATYWDHARDRLYLQIGVIDTHRPQLIPRVVYQTWYTRNLPEDVVRERRNMQQINPDYQFKLFLDAEMDKFVETNFDSRVYRAYSKLNIVTAKADFWRYLVLYKNGGVYIDMDSVIIKPLSSLIGATDEAVVTVQRNGVGGEPLFAQWGLIFAPGHPILNRTVEKIIDNITQRKFANSTLYLTGPVVYTDAIADLHRENFGDNFHSSHVKPTTDVTYTVKTPFKSSYRVFGVDYSKFFRVKFLDDVLNGKQHVHWRDEERQGKSALVSSSE